MKANFLRANRNLELKSGFQMATEQLGFNWDAPVEETPALVLVPEERPPPVIDEGRDDAHGIGTGGLHTKAKNNIAVIRVLKLIE